MTVFAAIGWFIFPALLIVWIVEELTSPKDEPLPIYRNKLEECEIEYLYEYLENMEKLETRYERDKYSKEFNEKLRSTTYEISRFEDYKRRKGI